MIDVIAIPRLTLFVGTRLLHFGACAAAKACHEKSKRADNFQAGEYVFHIFSFLTPLNHFPCHCLRKIYKFLLPDKLWIPSHEIDQDEMLNVRTIVPPSGFKPSRSRSQIPIRDYLISILPGLADRPISQTAELAPAAWAKRNTTMPTSSAV